MFKFECARLYSSNGLTNHLRTPRLPGSCLAASPLRTHPPLWRTEGYEAPGAVTVLLIVRWNVAATYSWGWGNSYSLVPHFIRIMGIHTSSAPTQPPDCIFERWRNQGVATPPTTSNHQICRRYCRALTRCSGSFLSGLLLEVLQVFGLQVGRASWSNRPNPRDVFRLESSQKSGFGVEPVTKQQRIRGLRAPHSPCRVAGSPQHPPVNGGAPSNIRLHDVPPQQAWSAGTSGIRWWPESPPPWTVAGPGRWCHQHLRFWGPNDSLRGLREIDRNNISRPRTKHGFHTCLSYF